MLDAIQKSFPQTFANACLQTLTEVELHIYDTDEKRCEIQTEPEGIVHFTVENPAAQDIHFLAIDKCLLFDNDEIQRCDCAIFNHKVFCFVEIKEVDHAARRADQNRKAKEQLKNTIRLFKEQLTFTTRHLEAYACVGRTTPRPARLASDLNDRLEFEDLGATFYHGNIKRFG